jgi:inhibitor of cysteine peptidase
LALVLVVSVAAASASGAGTCETITVGPAASGTLRMVHRGDRLVIRLPSNPSTGYSWTVRTPARPVLALTGRSFVPPPDGGRVGAPGTAVLRFRVAAVGRRTLRLAYARAWEQGVAPAGAFTLRIVARA